MVDFDIRFELFKEIKVNDDKESYITYGIRAKNGESEVGDVSVKLSEAIRILRVLNDNNVSVIHLKDIIEDILE